MRIIWTELAIGRLEEIVEYIAADNEKTSEKFALKIFTKVEKLSDNPEIGKQIRELNRKDIREIIEGNYRIIYRIESKRISILTVRHNRRQLDKTEVI